MNQDQIKDLAEDALNAACSVIQQRLGVDDGGFAALWFFEHREEMIVSILSDYIRAEIQEGAGSEKDLFLTMNGWKVEGDDLVRVSSPGQKLLTEEEIEVEVERAIDRLDKRFMRGELTQEEYDQEVHIVDRWSIQQMKALS